MPSASRGLARYRLFEGRTNPRVALEVSPARCRPAGSRWPAAVTEGSGGLRLVSPEFRCELKAGRSGTWAGRALCRDSPPALDSLLRVMVSALAPLEGQALMHAGAAAGPRGGVLLPGPSGAGKTTLAGALESAGVEVLGDELVLLAPEAGRLRIHATPFWGEFQPSRRAGSVPLARVCFPARARSHRGRAKASPIGRAEAHRRLMRCVVHFGGGRRALEAAWDLVIRACREVPAFELSWSLDAPPEAVAAALGGAAGGDTVPRGRFSMWSMDRASSSGIGAGAAR